MMRTTSFLLGLLLFAPAFAQTTPPPATQTAAPVQTATPPPAQVTPPPDAVVASTVEPKRPGPFVVGAGVGAVFPQAFSELGSHVLVGIEVGYRLRFFEQRIEIMGEVGYSPPGRGLDINRTEGPYEADVVSQQLHFSLGPRVRVMPGTSSWNVTIAVGPRIFLLRSSSNGSRGGQPFMEFTEQSTEVGFFAAVGGEYRLGPGAIFLDVGLAWAKMEHTIMGDTSVGNISLAAGYRLFLPWW